MRARQCSLALRDTSLPFLLGSTSYVWEAGLLENARRLRGLVDDMQLILFRTTDGVTNIPATDEVSRLADTAGTELCFSLHLPLFIHLTAEARDMRLRSMEEAAWLLALIAPLPLTVVVTHLEGSEPPECDEDGWERWRERAEQSLACLNELSPVPLCVENTERYPIQRALPLLEKLDQPLCIDIGHLMKMGEPVEPWIQQRLRRARAIHLHGWDGQSDHQPLGSSTIPDRALRLLLHEMAATGWDGILTLEVFGQSDFFQSREWLLQRWQSTISETGNRGNL
jgi:sugar phosphate isomerase/epimerase